MTSRPKLRNSTSSTDIDNEEACLDLLNRLIVLCNLHLPRATSLSDIRSRLFILLFEKICGTSVPDIIQEPKSLEDEAHNVQAIIDTISLDILAISLSHITGEDVVSQNVTAIYNLLEILEGFLLFMHNTSNAAENYGKDHGQTDKSSLSRKIGCSKKQSRGVSQTAERAVTLNEDSSSENTEEIIALGNLLNSNVFDNSKKESEKLQELHKQSACPATSVNYVVSETEKDLTCKFKKDNECQTEGDKWASSVVDKDKIPGKLSRNEEPCCIIWQHSSVELNYKSPSEGLQEGPLESLSDLAQDNIFVPSAHVSHPFVIKDCNLKPEFARVGLRDHQLIAPQDKSGKKVQEEIISEKHSSLGETSKGHTSVLPNTVIFKGEKVKKPHSLSKSITNLAAQKEARDQLCREVPLNRRKSKSLEDVFMVSPGYTRGLFEPDRNIRGSPEKKEKLELFQRKTSRKLNNQNSQHHAASTSSGFVANDLPAQYEKNLENRIRSFLESRDMHKHAALQMQKTYKRALKRPVRKVISPLCRKSFLLPYNLKRHSQSSTIPKRLHTRSSLHSAQTSIMNAGQQANNSKEEAVFLQELQEEFPNAYLSPGTVRCMSEKYEQQLFMMSKRIKDALQKKSLTQLQTEEAEKRQKILQNILKKEIYHQQHLKDFNEHKQLQTRVKVSQEEARQQSICAKHYYDEFHNQMRKKMQKRNFREEVLLKNVFEEGLQLQKQQVIQLRKKAAERQEKDARRHKIYMDALENYYQTQFALLAESLAIEKHDLQERAKAQKRVLQMMRREFRQQMENEVRVVQEQLVADNEDIHFREMDAERYREKLRDRYSAHPLRYKKFENL